MEKKSTTILISQDRWIKISNNEKSINLNPSIPICADERDSILKAITDLMNCDIKDVVETMKISQRWFKNEKKEIK